MPKVIYLLPCEHFITSESGSVSLISIIQELTVEIPRGSGIPAADAYVPKEWVIVNVVRHSDRSEIGKKFINHVEVIKQDGTGLVSKTPFVLMENGYLNKVNASGIPISPPGALSVKLWLYEEGQERPTLPNATYDEISIAYKTVELTSPAPEVPFSSGMVLIP